MAKISERDSRVRFLVFIRARGNRTLQWGLKYKPYSCFEDQETFGDICRGQPGTLLVFVLSNPSLWNSKVRLGRRIVIKCNALPRTNLLNRKAKGRVRKIGSMISSLIILSAKIPVGNRHANIAAKSLFIWQFSSVAPYKWPITSRSKNSGTAAPTSKIVTKWNSSFSFHFCQTGSGKKEKSQKGRDMTPLLPSFLPQRPQISRYSGWEHCLDSRLD